jgi:ABC-type uncharacterized transport system permease subunit
MTQPVELPRWMDVAVLPAVNLAFALAVAGIVVMLVGFEPGQVLALLVKGAFGSKAGISYTLYYATTFVFTGLAVAVAFHGGLFNIGGEGQAMMGGLGAGLAALAWSAQLPGWLMLPIMVLSAALFGLLWAAIPGALQAYRGSHTVITTIMFNFIAAALLSYLLVNTLKEPGNMTPESRAFADSARLPGMHELINWLGMEWPRTPLNLSVLLAVAAAVGAWLALWKTQGGYALRAVGFAPDASLYAGIRPKRLIVVAMAASGALAGPGGRERDRRCARPAAARLRGRRRLCRHRRQPDRPQPPGRHRAGRSAVWRAVPGRVGTGLRDQRFQPRHGVHAAGPDRAVCRRHGAGGRARPGPAVAPGRGWPPGAQRWMKY